jgi:hypothetical protein
MSRGNGKAAVFHNDRDARALIASVVLGRQNEAETERKKN